MRGGQRTGWAGDSWNRAGPVSTLLSRVTGAPGMAGWDYARGYCHLGYQEGAGVGAGEQALGRGGALSWGSGHRGPWVAARSLHDTC